MIVRRGPRNQELFKVTIYSSVVRELVIIFFPSHINSRSFKERGRRQEGIPLRQSTLLLRLLLLLPPLYSCPIRENVKIPVEKTIKIQDIERERVADKETMILQTDQCADSFSILFSSFARDDDDDGKTTKFDLRWPVSDRKIKMGESEKSLSLVCVPYRVAGRLLFPYRSARLIVSRRFYFLLKTMMMMIFLVK